MRYAGADTGMTPRLLSACKGDFVLFQGDFILRAFIRIQRFFKGYLKVI
jgi:hypothetical protein